MPENEIRTGGSPVQDARYLHAHAEFCLSLAAQISDGREAQNLRLTAADYLARAQKLEAGATDEPPALNAN